MTRPAGSQGPSEADAISPESRRPGPELSLTGRSFFTSRLALHLGSAVRTRHSKIRSQ